MRPKRTTTFDFTKRRLTEVIDFRGTQNLPKRPLMLPCDFCCTPVDRLWCRPVRAFGVEMWPQRYMVYDPSDRTTQDAGRWNACVFCNPMVQERNISLLVARVLTVNLSTKGVPASGFERLYGALFATFLDAPVLEWHAGDVFPVPV